MKDRISVFYSTDDNFVYLTLVSMVSLLENTKEDVDIFILYSRLSQKAFSLLYSVKKYKHCRLSFVQIDENWFKGYQIWEGITLPTWYRVKIPDLFPELDKAIYLDCDTLVIGDIKELWDFDMKGASMAAVKMPAVKDAKINCIYLEMTSGNYINDGVLLINCKKWREIDVFKQVKQYVEENKDEFLFADEIVLNKILDEDKTILPFKFNYQEIWFFKKGVEYEEFDMEEYREAAKNPVIVHFIGPKPYLCTNRQTYKSEWWRYAKMTEGYQFYLEMNFYNTEIMYEKLSKKLGCPFETIEISN